MEEQAKGEKELRCKKTVEAYMPMARHGTIAAAAILISLVVIAAILMLR